MNVRLSAHLCMHQQMHVNETDCYLENVTEWDQVPFGNQLCQKCPC